MRVIGPIVVNNFRTSAPWPDRHPGPDASAPSLLLFIPELENVMEHTDIRAQERRIGPEDLPLHLVADTVAEALPSLPAERLSSAVLLTGGWLCVRE